MITSSDKSIWFCSSADSVFFTYSTASSGERSISIFFRHVSTRMRTSRQLSRRTVSMPFASSLSQWSGFVQNSPAYRFLFISRYGQYTFSNSSRTGLGKRSDTSAAASLPICIASSTVSTPNFTMTESVSPYTITASCLYPFFTE